MYPSRSHTVCSGKVQGDGAIYFNDLETALAWCKARPIPTIWIIGGKCRYQFVIFLIHSFSQAHKSTILPWLLRTGF